jgi:hypothetical protein
MTKENDPLKKLFTDDDNVDTNDLFDLLSPFVRLNRTTKNIIFLDAIHNQTTKNRLLVFLLAKKALFLLGETENDKVKPQTIVEETGIPRGSVLPGLKSLREPKGGNLVSSKRGEYFISSYQISKIKSKKILNNHEENK